MKAGDNDRDARRQETRTRLRALGVSELGIAQYGCLNEDQQEAIRWLLDQYVPNKDGNRRIDDALG